MAQSSSGPFDEYPMLRCVPPSDRHRLMASRRRRLVLEVVAEHEETVHLREIATHIASAESETDTPDGKTVNQIAVDLHHTHLPYMAACDAISYDPDTHLVDITPKTGHLE